MNVSGVMRPSGPYRRPGVRRPEGRPVTTGRDVYVSDPTPEAEAFILGDPGFRFRAGTGGRLLYVTPDLALEVLYRFLP